MKILRASYQTEFLAYPTIVDNSDLSPMVGMEFESVDQALDFAFELGNVAPVKLIFIKQSGTKMISYLSNSAGKRITKPIKNKRSFNKVFFSYFN
jgi:hypothetical protein